MADSTIDSNLIVLYDNWPGAAMQMQDGPVDGFTGSTHHNVAAAVFRLGEKIQVYNAGTSPNVGFSTFIYLKLVQGGAAAAAKRGVVPDSATDWFTVTDDPDDAINIPGGLFAYTISAMTTAYYGWFWCGGVCPEAYVSGLSGNYATVNALTAGAFMASNLSADAIGITVPAAATDVAVGYTLADDA